MTGSDGRHKVGQGGQSIAELALLAPVILLILLLAVDFGRVFLGWVTVTNMARIGANYASLNPKGFQAADPAVAAQYRRLMENDATEIDCTVPSPVPLPSFAGYSLGDEVTVAMSCDFGLITPFLSDLFGNGDGKVAIGAAAIFNVRAGAVNDVPVNPPGVTLPPPSSSPSPSPSNSPGPSTSPGSSGSPPPTLPPVNVSFWGEAAPGQPDASGGGPPGSPNEGQIVGIAGTQIVFSNTTTGTKVTCLWDFGDGATTSNCAGNVTRTYAARGLFTVTLTVNGSTLSRQNYVLISCKVPDFHGVKKNDALALWSSPAVGFTGGLTSLPGSGNYKINYQSLVSGQVNPPGGCAAGITVGP